jgi:hypothetical protein
MSLVIPSHAKDIFCYEKPPDCGLVCYGIMHIPGGCQHSRGPVAIIFSVDVCRAGIWVS